MFTIKKHISILSLSVILGACGGTLIIEGQDVSVIYRTASDYSYYPSSYIEDLSFTLRIPRFSDVELEYVNSQIEDFCIQTETTYFDEIEIQIDCPFPFLGRYRFDLHNDSPEFWNISVSTRVTDLFSVDVQYEELEIYPWSDLEFDYCYE
ncbi:MAG: hypothetical protein KDD52_05980 [Bdellovibrionales bacterium]|nr:hypothetical protein [Bdellovibrionales bacterium]